VRGALLNDEASIVHVEYPGQQESYDRGREEGDDSLPVSLALARVVKGQLSLYSDPRNVVARNSTTACRVIDLASPSDDRYEKA
jgi:hypothetical protein